MGCSQQTITNQDWNTITNPGLYYVTGMTGDNKPKSYNYGILEVIVFGNIILQRYYPDVNNVTNLICYRTSYGIYGWRKWLYLALT